MGVFFSVARFFHHYYLIMLAPGIAALVGIAVAALWRAYRRGGVRLVGLPRALVAVALVQVGILSDFPQWSARLAAPMLGVVVAAALALLLVRRWQFAAATALTIGLVALLVAPTVWSVISVQDSQGGAWLPQAGPGGSFGRGGFPGGAGGAGQGRGNQQPGGFGQGAGGFPGGAQGGGQQGGGFANGGRGGQSRGGQGAFTFVGDPWQSLDRGMVDYLLARQGSDPYLVATSSSYASLFILATDQPALALGGYQG